MKYEVIDTRTGEVVTPASLKAEIEALLDRGRGHAQGHWAWPVYMYRIATFALDPDGGLYLMDKCGNYIYPPPNIQARAIKEAESE